MERMDLIAVLFFAFFVMINHPLGCLPTGMVSRQSNFYRSLLTETIYRPASITLLLFFFLF